MDESNMERSNEPVEPTGLSEAEVAARMEQHGYNELPSSKGRSIFATAWDVVREPMFLLLLACGTIYLLLGDVQEAVMLLGFVFVVLGIAAYALAMVATMPASVSGAISASRRCADTSCW